MRDINTIIIHCSATPAPMDIGVEEIREWHVEKGWSDIGYHYVIRRNGTLEAGRPLELQGSHVYGENSDSIGICLVGGTTASGDALFNFTSNQMLCLMNVVQNLSSTYSAKVAGHRDFNSKKECPCFDVKQFFKEVIDDEHLI